jgi:hypothetical protein
MEWIPIAAAAFTSGVLTGLLAYRARDKRTPANHVRECVSVVWCSHCGMPQSAFCQAHKLPANIVRT